MGNRTRGGLVTPDGPFGEGAEERLLAATVRLAAALWPDRMLLAELELPNTRLDLAGVGDGVLHGFELKTERDTLKRLPRQVRDYGGCMSRMTLVAAPNHLDGAAALVPGWWGLWEAEPTDGGYAVRPVRDGAPNPSPSPASMVQMLEKDQALRVLELAGGLDRGFRTKTRWEIWDRIVAHVPEESLRASICDRLRNRARAIEAYRPIREAFLARMREGSGAGA